MKSLFQNISRLFLTYIRIEQHNSVKNKDQLDYSADDFVIDIQQAAYDCTE